MKCSYSPFSAASADSSLTRMARSTELPLGIEDADRLAAHFGDVAFLEELEAARHRQQCRRVRGDEVLVLAMADHHRAAHAREDQPVRLRLAQHHQRVGAFKLGDRGAHGLEQVAQRSHVVVDAVRDDLGVGLGRELVALRP